MLAIVDDLSLSSRISSAGKCTPSLDVEQAPQLQLELTEYIANSRDPALGSCPQALTASAFAIFKLLTDSTKEIKELMCGYIK